MHAWECRRRDALFTICSEYSFRPGCRPVRGTDGTDGTDEKLRRWSVRSEERSGGSGDETTADAKRVFTKLLGPHAFEIHANGWKDWHVKNSEKRVRNAFFTGEIERDAAETEVHDPGAM